MEETPNKKHIKVFPNVPVIVVSERREPWELFNKSNITHP